MCDWIVLLVFSPHFPLINESGFQGFYWSFIFHFVHFVNFYWLAHEHVEWLSLVITVTFMFSLLVPRWIYRVIGCWLM